MPTNQSISPKPEELSTRIAHLRHDVSRWIHEVQAGKARGTLLFGIAKKAVDGLELVLRDLFEYCLQVCAIDYETQLRDDMDGKPIDRLTMGQVLMSFDKLNVEITRRCRLRSSFGKNLLRNRRLLSRSDKKQLEEILAFRNKLHHHQDEFSHGSNRLAPDIHENLERIRNLLNQPMFTERLWQEMSSP